MHFSDRFPDDEQNRKGAAAHMFQARIQGYNMPS